MKTVGLFKRLIIIVYDGMLLISVAAFLSAILMGIVLWLAPDSFFVDPANLENPKLIELSEIGRTTGGVLISLNVIIVSFFFYGWFWTHGGQTLGMKAWNLYLIKPDGKFVNWKLAAYRYCAAIISWAFFGMGFTWILLNRKQRAWHDILSNTQIVYAPAKKTNTANKT